MIEMLFFRFIHWLRGIPILPQFQKSSNKERITKTTIGYNSKTCYNRYNRYNKMDEVIIHDKI